jgi:hypothetical protein
VETVRPVRAAFAIIPALLLAVSAQGQTTQKERSLYERIMKPDTNKTFDPATQPGIGSRSFKAGSAQTKEFRFNQRFAPSEFRTKDFQGSKRSQFTDFKFATKEARTKGAYETKAADVKSADTKGARDSEKTVSTHEVWDGGRQYLGPESKKLDKAVDPNKQLEGWKGDFKQLTLEDIRELLNKNK